MKKTDLAYMAGIVDGEGSISLVLMKKTLTLVVQVTNTNEWLIQSIKMCFGGAVRLAKPLQPEKNWKPTYRWVVTSMQALEFLKLVYPYLRLKKSQAEIAIKFLELRGTKGRWLSEKEKTIAEAQRIVMSKLNKRGIK